MPQVLEGLFTKKWQKWKKGQENWFFFQQQECT